MLSFLIPSVPRRLIPASICTPSKRYYWLGRDRQEPGPGHTASWKAKKEHMLGVTLQIAQMPTNTEQINKGWAAGLG